MADTAVVSKDAPATPAPATAQPQEIVLAGKYKGTNEVEAAGKLLDGLRELHKTQGLAKIPDGDVASLIGDGKLFNSVEEAVKAYKSGERLMGKPKDEQPVKPIDTPMFPKEKQPEPDTTTPVDANKVLKEAGFSGDDIYRMEKANALTDSVVDKIALAHDDFKNLPPRTRIPAMRAVLKEHIQSVDSHYESAYEVVGGRDKFAELGSNWESYVPASKHAELAALMGDAKNALDGGKGVQG